MRFSCALVLLLACSDVTPSQRLDLQKLNTAVSADERQIDAVQVRATELSAEWDDVVEAYQRATAAFQVAERHYTGAKAKQGMAQVQLEEAREAFETAKQHWIWARYLIEAAAAVDSANMDARRASSAGKAHISCEDGMSTASFRRLLTSRGVDLTGKDIDHIVPHSLGGADHPMNYQVISSSLNRSIGAMWNSDKCAIAGREACARAVVVSRGCGAYSGSMPGL